MMSNLQALLNQRVNIASCFIGVIFLASCATTGQLPPLPKPAKPSAPVFTQPKPVPRPAGPLPPSTRPTYNLSGFPPATKEGYIDGCETAKKTRWGYKDEVRYTQDLQYRMGWDDGHAICRGQVAQ